MLHNRADGINGFPEGSAERSFLPASGVPLHTEAIAVGAQAGKSNTIVVVGSWCGAERLPATGNQMISAHANVHAGGELVGREQLGELGLSGAHRIVHESQLTSGRPR